jgi:hypothetical protein
MAVFQCTSCRRLLFRPDDLIGRAWQCPACGPVVVGDEMMDVSPALAALLEDEYRLGLSRVSGVVWEGEAPAEPLVPARREPRPPEMRHPPPPVPSAAIKIDAPAAPEADRVPGPMPSSFRHRWGLKALREAILFLLFAFIVLAVTGLFLPISSDLYWLLLKLVAGISAGVGVLYYLLTVLPRIVYYGLVDLYRRHGGIPDATARLWTGRAATWGFRIGAAIPVVAGAAFVVKGRVEQGLLVAVCGIGTGFFGGYLALVLEVIWIGMIRTAGHTFGLPPPEEPAAGAGLPAERGERPPSPIGAERSPDSADVVSMAREQAIKPGPTSLDIRVGE